MTSYASGFYFFFCGQRDNSLEWKEPYTRIGRAVSSAHLVRYISQEILRISETKRGEAKVGKHDRSYFLFYFFFVWGGISRGRDSSKVEQTVNARNWL